MKSQDKPNPSQFSRKQLTKRPAGRGLRIVTIAAAALLVFPSASKSNAAENRPVKQKVSPIYPEIAKRMKVSGVVTIAATVAADGSVKTTKIVSGSSMLSGAAEDAVHRWKFATAPEESTVEVQVSFALAQ